MEKVKRVGIRSEERAERKTDVGPVREKKYHDCLCVKKYWMDPLLDFMGQGGFLDRQPDETESMTKSGRESKEGGEVLMRMSHVGRRDGGNS